MTREEAIRWMEDEKSSLEYAPTLNGCQMTKEWQDAIDVYSMAISALRQQELSSYSQVVESSDMFDEDGGEILKGETVKDRHQMTNADRIRSMSEKELVKIPYSGAPHCISKDPAKCNRHDFVDGLSPCEQCYLKWLQQPAEGNHEV